VFKSTDHAANLFALKEFGNIYSRLMSPADDVLEKRLAALDGGTWTLLAQTLKKLGIEVRLFDPGPPEELPRLIDANTRLVYRKSIGNPKDDVPDFHRPADTAHWHGRPPGGCRQHRLDAGAVPLRGRRGLRFLRPADGADRLGRARQGGADAPAVPVPAGGEVQRLRQH
jgi:hypothetical protein